MILLLACSGPSTPDLPADPAGDPACHADADLDGFGDPASSVRCTRGVADATDCDDADPYVNPGEPEVCDGLDDDCDGAVDDADDDLADGLPFWPDADGDGWGDDATVVTDCEAGSSAVTTPGDCDDADPAVHPGADEGCEGVDLDCDGFASTAGGAAPGCPGESCAAILAADPGAPDGARWLALPSGTVAEVWCDMTTDGGGWTLGFSRNTASTGSQGDFGSGEVSVEGLAMSPADASASSTPVLSWLDLNDFPFTELRLGAYGSGSATYSSRVILASELRIPFGSDGYLLYGGTTGYYWCGGDATYTDGGVGATNNPADAPLDCKGHGSLGSGWDFSESPSVNQGLTLCGGDGSYFLAASWGGGWTYYGAAGGAQAIWVR